MMNLWLCIVLLQYSRYLHPIYSMKDNVMSDSDIFNRHCVPCEGGVPPLGAERVASLLTHLSDWHVNDTHTAISRAVSCKDFHETMALVNAIADIAHQQNHHPNLVVGYDHCHITFSTHAIGGLSENDFICARLVDGLLSC